MRRKKYISDRLPLLCFKSTPLCSDAQTAHPQSTVANTRIEANQAEEAGSASFALTLKASSPMDPLLAMKDLVLKMEPSAQGISDADFLRFLHARDGDEVNAAKFMVQHLQWRRSYVPKGFIDEREIETELNRKQIFMQGHDRHGCPIIVILTSRHRAYERDLDEIKRFFVYAFDKATFSNKGDEGKFIIIGDLKDWGLANMDIQGYLAVLDILQNQYPERLRKLYLVHLPYLFWGAWKIVSPLIDKNTRKKVVLVEDLNVEKLLLEDMDKDQIPDIYGGNTELVPIQDSLTTAIG